MSPLKAIAESKPVIKTALEHDALVNKIRSATGCGSDLAEDYAKAIERKQEIQLGKVLVRDVAGRIIARLPESVLFAKTA